jgi:hypothetical protein
MLFRQPNWSGPQPCAGSWMISVKSGPMPAGLAGAERGGGRRGWSWHLFGSNVSNGVPGSFDRMF